MVVGGTGSGKTTFLKTLCSCIPVEEHIITIEDSWELNLEETHHNVSNLLFSNRQQSIDQGVLIKPVTATQLVSTSMRMAPSRLLLGELRDEAAFDYLGAGLSGHKGMSSMHAESVTTSADRFVMLASGHPNAVNIKPDMMHEMFLSNTDIIAHIELTDTGRRLTHLQFDPEGTNRHREAFNSSKEAPDIAAFLMQLLTKNKSGAANE